MMNKSLSILTMSALMVACSDGGKNDTGVTDLSPQNPKNTNSDSSLVRQVQSSALLDEGCGNGGSVFEFGFDFNENGALDDAEVDSERTKILCHGEEGEVGYSAFQIWTMAGNEGTEADFLASLVGTVGADGNNGDDGSSAYQIWLTAGNAGTEVDFLASLVGQNGGEGTKGDTGVDGLSAYEIWLAAGNSGTEADFLASLAGTNGGAGTNGSNGFSAPAITSSSYFYINENTHDSYTVTAFDADEADVLSFAIVGGEDADLFDINTETGIVSFKVSPDYEAPADRDENNVYEVDLSVTDGTYTTTKALLVKVRNFEIIPAVSIAEIISIPANEVYYTADEIVTVAITFDFPVSVEGSPQLALTMGDQVRVANYLPEASNEISLHFSYTIVAEDREGEGIRINENALSLNGSVIASTNLVDGLAISLISEAVASNQQVEDEAPVLLGSSVTSQFTQVIPSIDSDDQEARDVRNTLLVDKDADGDLDLFYIRGKAQRASWLINNNGELNQLQRGNQLVITNNSKFDVKIIDVDNEGNQLSDGYPDIVFVRGGHAPDGIEPLNNMTIYISDGAEAINEMVLDFPEADFSGGNVSFADMNGDGFDDVVVATAEGATVDLGDGVQDYAGRILVVLNDGNNEFSPANSHYWGSSLSESGSMLNIVDLDGDGLPEIIATAVNGSTEAKLFKNETASPDALNLVEVGLGFNIDSHGKKSVHLDVNGDNLQDILISGPRTALGEAVVEDTGNLTLFMNTSSDGVISLAEPIDFTDVPSAIGMLGAGDLDGDGIDDFAFKTLTSSAWYKGDGAGSFTKFNQSNFRTNDQAELSMGLSIGNLTGNDLNGNPLNEVVSALGHGNDKGDSEQACNWCLDIWQNTPSYDLEMLENAAEGTLLTTFDANDIDSDVIFSLEGPDSSFFAINAEGELTVNSPLNFAEPQDAAATTGNENADEATNLNAVAGDNFYQLSIVISDGPNKISTPITILVNEVIEEVIE